MHTYVLLMVSRVVLNGTATGAYIGGGLGPGLRDGLMTALAARGDSVRLVPTGIEVSVLLTGWLPSGTGGPGTIVYALGSIAHVSIPPADDSSVSRRTIHVALAATLTSTSC